MELKSQRERQQEADFFHGANSLGGASMVFCRCGRKPGLDGFIREFSLTTKSRTPGALQLLTVFCCSNLVTNWLQTGELSKNFENNPCQKG
jgi:hypothetical protein